MLAASRSGRAPRCAGPYGDHRSTRDEETAKPTTCTHLAEIRDVTPSAAGCEDCLRDGGTWVHPRMCLSCGHVGCCDSSPNRHATRHFRATHHPVVRSAEEGEDWRWCYVDEAIV